MADDETRWAEALAILENRPTESAERRLRRARRNRVLAVVAFVVVTVAVAVVVALLFLDGGGGPDRDGDVPTWQAVLGFSLSGLGLVIMVVGTVVLIRRLRATHAWHSPLNVLTFRQRNELTAQLRGHAPVVPERAPLVAHLAEMQLAQRAALLPQVGLLISFAGQWIAAPSTWRLVLVGVLGAVLLAGALFGRRETERARRFLDEQPLADAEPAGD